MILQVFNSSVVSGPETLAIPALKKIGEEVEVAFLLETRVEKGGQEVIAYIEKHGYKVHTIVVRSRFDLRAIQDLRNLINNLKPRVIHAQDTKASVYTWRACKKLSYKPNLVSTHHGAAARKGIIRFYEEIYVRLCLNSFDHVLCMGQSDCVSLSARGVDQKKLQIHLNGVDRPKVEERDREDTQKRIRASWAEAEPRLAQYLNRPTVWMGAVARLSHEKRHDRMLAVLSSLKKAGSNAILVCFGRGAEDEKLKALTRELGLENHVFWMGFRGSIGNELAGFDLVLCLSDGEGIPINLLEAAWAGSPVLSTNVGGIPDFIHAPTTGFLVEKNESDASIAIKTKAWIENTAELRKRGLAFQADVEKNFSEKSWLETLKKVYLE